MKYKIFLFLTYCFAFCFDIDELAKSLKGDILGDFNQTKSILGFEKNITSSGEFSLKSEEFILNTTKPIKNSTKVDKNGVFVLKNGDWVKNERAIDLQLFLSIINIDVASLKKEFEPNLSGNQDGWKLELTPKGFMVSKIFKNIEIWGDKYVKKIRLTEINGDITQSEFSVK
ncbi:LolA family protein [Campylobacter suis]|uniref:Outer membrane lipoprotein carrier protein LolA n=1 Tax=Campylobacter suis TaxID=2790657 RepID=A0ABM8Q064_9BACT|nr:outer membrane lipoprotein carrier protein LolA [Campylobacter suis]CAD7286190.1 hypothetical protein LMG8286_00021 [Campylobacter suis]